MGDSLEIYNSLIEKCEKADVCVTHLEAMEKLLETEEFNYLVVSMFFGVADNGGFLHAHNCFYLDDDDQFITVCRALQAIGCVASIQTSKFIKDYVSSRGAERAELMEDGEWAKLEDLSDDLYARLSKGLKICEDTLLDEYMLRIYKSG